MTAALLAFNAFTGAVMIFAFVRHEWVFKVRENALAESRRRFERMAPFGQMVAQFWVWDSHKFDGAAR